MKSLRIATRESPLALWQAEFVRDELQRHHESLDIELIGMTTQGRSMAKLATQRSWRQGLIYQRA